MTPNFASVSYARDLSVWHVIIMTCISPRAVRSFVCLNERHADVRVYPLEMIIIYTYIHAGFLFFWNLHSPPLFLLFDCACCRIRRHIRIVYNYQLSTRSTTTTKLMILHSWTAASVFLRHFFLSHTALHIIVICFSSSPSHHFGFWSENDVSIYPPPSPTVVKHYVYKRVQTTVHTDNVFYGGSSKGSERGRV